jgi:bifunctional enzyme CysN/CysC/sulfate adenylyltransferase subunit 1
MNEAENPSPSTKARMNIVITGHVDHGKSTLIGRLLADTGSLPEGKIQAVEASCARGGRAFEYAFLLDALADEQSQGITIDSARVFFKSGTREYIIIDAPGHIEFLRNMLSGASRAEAAILVIDAVDGVAENSKRHGLLLSLIGVTRVVVAVNKMDMVSYDRAVFERIKTEYEQYLAKLGVKPAAFVPVSAREGKNITALASETPWYTGKTVLETLDGFEPPVPDEDAFFAMPVQDIYRFSAAHDERRIYAGSVVSGEISAGEEVSFVPSGKTARIKTIEVWNAPPKSRTASGEAAGFTLYEDIYVKRGEVMVKRAEQGVSGGFVPAGGRIRANLIWLGAHPLTVGKTCLFKLGCARVDVRLERIERFPGENEDGAASAFSETGFSGTARQELARHECGSVILSFSRPVALSPFYVNASLGRFVLVDGFDAAGCGIVLENLSAQKTDRSHAVSECPDSGDFEAELFALLKKYFPHRFAGER